MDRLSIAVAQELTSRYCPTNKALFLSELFISVAVLLAIGITLLTRGGNARLAGILLLLFSAGMAALDLFGFFGCGPHFTPGLTWDHPW